jgi:hypothetical protein
MTAKIGACGVKLFIYSASIVALWSSIVTAQTLPKRNLIDQIESIIARSTKFSDDSSLVESYMDSAKRVNPSVNNETWLVIKEKMAIALFKLISDKDAYPDPAIRKSLQNLSEAELERIGQIFNDPAYIKFLRGAIPTTQETLEWAHVYGRNISNLYDTVNGVLENNGLNKMRPFGP